MLIEEAGGVPYAILPCHHPLHHHGRVMGGKPHDLRLIDEGFSGRTVGIGICVPILGKSGCCHGDRVDCWG